MVLLVLACGSLYAETNDPEDRTLSPYFFVNSGNPDTDRLPLKSTQADVVISGVLANVVVTQVYKNDGKRPLEALYIFPASTRAAVYGMKMTIGKREIEAKIKKRDEARRDYEQARNEGKSASLLEQQRPNVFQMNVANIMPGDEIRVELKYTELLTPTDRIYEFVFPTVVGPRYSGAKASHPSPSEQWVANPYLRQGKLSQTGLNINVAIFAGMPIKDVTCPSHKVQTVYSGASEVKVSLDKSESHGGNRDYLLRFRLGGDKVATGLLLSQGKQENFFVLMMQPPKRISSAIIPGREYIFIVDVSGSMHGFPLDISKKLLADLIGNLRPTDKFNVLLFSGGSSLMAETSLPATPANIQRAMATIDRQQGGGATELLPALKRAMSLKKDDNFSRTMVIVTDGYVNVEEEAFDFIHNNLGKANLFAFGIGSSVNRHIIEGMAHVGLGEPFVITKPDAAEGQAQRFRKMIQSPVLTQVKVKFNSFDAYAVEPVAVPDVLADRPILIFGKWRGNPQGTISISGHTGEGKYSKTIKVEDFKPLDDKATLKYLWARHRIGILSDYNRLCKNDKRIQEVTDLGLKYSLLTAYTSFVAVDSQIRNASGKLATVQQPLPLPEGVSDYAVGGIAKGRVAPLPQAISEVRYKSEARFAEEKLAAQEILAPSKKDQTGRLEIVQIKTEKGYSKDDILKVARAGLPQIEKCMTGKGQAFLLKVEITVKSDGTVQEVKILSGDREDKKNEQCLRESLAKWRFAPIKSSQTIKIMMTIKSGA